MYYENKNNLGYFFLIKLSNYRKNVCCNKFFLSKWHKKIKVTLVHHIQQVDKASSFTNVIVIRFNSKTIIEIYWNNT